MSPILFLSLAFSAACSTAVAEDCNAMLQTDLRSASGMMSRLDFKRALEQGGSKAIPCIIHQTAKTHTLKAKESAWAQTWKDMNPKCQYKLWNDTEIEALAQKASPKIIWPIWEGLQPVQRADVFRYLVLWYEGGYYADVDVSCKKPIDEYKLPESTNMIVGYEFGHRFPEWQRAQIKFARTEQFQQWFIASAPGNPVLLRCLELIRQRYTWKVESTLELTGPGVFSDAVHEFLEMKSPHAVEKEVEIRRHPPDAHFLSYPSESLFGYGRWKMWVFAAGRVNAAPMIAADDPTEGPENMVEHHFEGSWKKDQDMEDSQKRREAQAATDEAKANTEEQHGEDSQKPSEVQVATDEAKANTEEQHGEDSQKPSEAQVASDEGKTNTEEQHGEDSQKPSEAQVATDEAKAKTEEQHGEDSQKPSEAQVATDEAKANTEEQHGEDSQKPSEAQVATDEAKAKTEEQHGEDSQKPIEAHAATDEAKANTEEQHGEDSQKPSEAQVASDEAKANTEEQHGEDSQKPSEAQVASDEGKTNTEEQHGEDSQKPSEAQVATDEAKAKTEEQHGEDSQKPSEAQVATDEAKANTEEQHGEDSQKPSEAQVASDEAKAKTEEQHGEDSQKPSEAQVATDEAKANTEEQHGEDSQKPSEAHAATDEGKAT